MTASWPGDCPTAGGWRDRGRPRKKRPRERRSTLPSRRTELRSEWRAGRWWSLDRGDSGPTDLSRVGRRRQERSPAGRILGRPAQRPGTFSSGVNANEVSLVGVKVGVPVGVTVIVQVTVGVGVGVEVGTGVSVATDAERLIVGTDRWPLPSRTNETVWFEAPPRAAASTEYWMKSVDPLVEKLNTLLLSEVRGTRTIDQAPEPLVTAASVADVVEPVPFRLALSSIFSVTSIPAAGLRPSARVTTPDTERFRWLTRTTDRF